jgi:hypothetical protein
MIRMTAPLRLAAALLLPLLLALPGLAWPAAPVAIISAEFGLFHDGAPNELVFEPTSVVPRRPGQRYGWIITVRTGKRTLTVREEYLLPEAAANKVPDSQVARNLHIPDLRRSQVSQRQLVPVDDQIFGEWSIGPDEPPGHRRLQVIVEGEVAASFEYDVK